MVLAATFCVLFLVVAIGGYRVWSRLEVRFRRAAAEPRPHLVFAGRDSAVATTVVGGPGVSMSPLVSAGTAEPTLVSVVGPAASGAPGPGYELAVNHYVRVFVANDPGERIGACAQRVAATIAFLDERDTPLLEMIGRWAETPQRLETGRIGLTLEESQLDIDGNALPHALDIAMKTPADDHFYAFNHENSQAPDLRRDAHRIAVGHCRVRVRVRAANAAPITRTFTLRNEGVGGGLSLEDDE